MPCRDLEYPLVEGFAPFPDHRVVGNLAAIRWSPATLVQANPGASGIGAAGSCSALSHAPDGAGKRAAIRGARLLTRARLRLVRRRSNKPWTCQSGPSRARFART